MALVVQKYGGTSVACVERIRAVAQRIAQSRQSGNKVVVVLSAMGKTTDRLLKMATDIDPCPEGRELDMLVSTGEQAAAALLSIALRQQGCNAISLAGWQAGILTEAKHTDAQIVHIDPTPIERRLAEGKVVVVAGFQGVSADGEITTLGRGGSDTSAVALAGSLGAEICEIFTDVEGVYTADPRTVPTAQKIHRITYSDMLELARSGAGVLHPRSVEEAMKKQVPLVVRSSFTEREGTYVGQNERSWSAQQVCGIAHQEKMSVLCIKRKSYSTDHVDTELTEILHEADIYAEVWARGKNSLDICLPTYQVNPLLALLQVKVDGGVDFWREELEWTKINIIGVNHSSIQELMQKARDFTFPIRWGRQGTKGASCLVPQKFSKRAIQALHTGLGLDAKMKAIVGS
ncbi:aspartate kinase [Brevibacillus sp. AG162]|uniref:aspartate kinase n=1 Tax=Brevibacillus sp. AG162 TaxID=2572910 RepID=UPI00115033DE|nr:aspartate kinase [Brevibacillus sp. AG162]TQK53407.1 aspartate kinase [Brevibacillus sp. AG162]